MVLPLRTALSRMHPVICAGGLAAASLLAAAVLPGGTARYTASPFLLAAAVLGYMAGMALPPRVQLVVHPILVSGAAPNAGAALHGLLTGAGYWATLQGFVTRVGWAGAGWGRGCVPLPRAGRLAGCYLIVCLTWPCPQQPSLAYGSCACDMGLPCLLLQGKDGFWGAGDLLFSFLGVVILSFGFKVFEQWPVMRRHAVEILAATASSALFAMVTSAGMARAAGLPPAVARGLVPRSGGLVGLLHSFSEAWLADWSD